MLMIQKTEIIGNNYYKDEIKKDIQYQIDRDQNLESLNLKVIKVNTDLSEYSKYYIQTRIWINYIYEIFVDSRYNYNSLEILIKVLPLTLFTFIIFINIDKVNIKSKILLNIIFTALFSIIILIFFSMPSNNLIKKMAKEEKLNITVDIGILDHIFTNTEYNFDIYMYSKEENKNDYKININNKYFLSSNYDLLCRVLNYSMSKKGYIEDQVINNLVKENKNIDINLYREKDYIRVERSINLTSHVSLNNYLNYNENSIDIINVDNKNIEATIKCHEGYFSLYYDNILVLRGERKYNTDLKFFIESNFKRNISPLKW